MASSLEHEARTVRHLHWYDLTAFGIATTIGSGIYVTCGLVARNVTGPAVILSTALAGVLSILIALCYLEFSTALPIEGSAYAYFYILVGEFLAWFIGWNLTLEYAFSAAAIAGGWTNYLVTLMDSLGWKISVSLYQVPLFGMLRINVIAAVLTVLVGAVVARGLHFGARFTNGITCFNLVLIGFIIGVGSFYVKPQNWRPFLLEGTTPGAILHGAGEMFFSYLGFDTVTTLAGDAINPSRDIPLATIGTVVTATVLYMAVGLVLTGLQPAAELDSLNPLALAFRAVNCNWAYYIVTMCALTTMTVTIFTSLVGQPKIWAAMARDGLLPHNLSRPSWGVSSTIVLTALLALFFDVRSGLIDMISFGCLFCMSAVCAAVINHRFSALHTLPDRQEQSVGKLGTASTVTLFMGSLVTSATWHNLRWPYFLAAFSVSVLAPFTCLAYLFVRHNGMLTSRLLSLDRKVFQCPGMPLLPSLAIFANSMVMLKTPWRDIAMFTVWAGIGIMTYFFYGMGHAKLGKMELVERFSGEAETEKGKEQPSVIQDSEPPKIEQRGITEESPLIK